MEITPAQFAQTEHCLPCQRGNVSLPNLNVSNTQSCMASSTACKWRGLPKRFGNFTGGAIFALAAWLALVGMWAGAGLTDRRLDGKPVGQLMARPAMTAP